MSLQVARSNELMKSAKWEGITKILSSKDCKCQLLGLLTLSLCFCAEPQKLVLHPRVMKITVSQFRVVLI